jgi:DNA-binding winged helix-turn-helix (wHTH) protein
MAAGEGDGPRAPFTVGEWLVEPQLDRICRGGEPCPLRPRVMELLLCLAERAGELASKQHIIDSVWQTEFVTVNALTKLVAELRSALDDDAEAPRYIETIPRRGYRLIAAVSRAEPAPAVEVETAYRCALVDDDGTEIGLREGENTIGRAPDAAIRIDSSEVSRRHACIRVKGSTAILEDLGSKNGTYLRGRRLERPALLDDADEIQIGVKVARYRFKLIDERTRTEQLDSD